MIQSEIWIGRYFLSSELTSKYFHLIPMSVFMQKECIEEMAVSKTAKILKVIKSGNGKIGSCFLSFMF